MNRLRWLALVAMLALALGGIRALLGDSWVSLLSFFLIVFVALEVVQGRRNWLGAVLGALVATALYLAYLYLLPLDTLSKQLGMIVLASLLALPVIARVLRNQRRRQHEA